MLTPRNEEELKLADVAWAAGLFEGEGCTRLHHVVNKEGREYFYPMLVVGSTDEDVVRQFHRIIGVGHIHVRKMRGRMTKPLWVWQASSKRDTSIAAKQLYPYLGERRRAKMREIGVGGC